MRKGRRLVGAPGFVKILDEPGGKAQFERPGFGPGPHGRLSFGQSPKQSVGKSGGSPTDRPDHLDPGVDRDRESVLCRTKARTWRP